MKNSGKKIITFFAAIFIVILSFAGNKLSIEERANNQMLRMNTICELNMQQQAEVKQLYVVAITKLMAERKEKDKLKKANKTNLKATPSKPTASPAKQEFSSSLQTILTPEQMNKWEAANKKKKQ